MIQSNQGKVYLKQILTEEAIEDWSKITQVDIPSDNRQRGI